MSQSFNVRKLVIATIIVAILLTVIGLTRNRPELSTLEKFVLDITAPIQRGWTEVSNTFAKGWQGIAEIRHLKAERDQLAKTVRDLRRENRQYKEDVLENARLKSLLDFQNQIPYQTESARVIGRSVNNWFSLLIVDKGALDGIRKGMTVVGNNGLIGQITTVSNHTAQVLLILDQNSAASGLIQESRENGIVEGSVTGNLVMQRLPRDAKVKAGDHVLSSGLGGIFPKGIYIGRVAKVESGNYDISKKAIVIPAENFNALEEVLIITNNVPRRPLTTEEGGNEQ